MGIDGTKVRVLVFKGATYHRALSLASSAISDLQPDLILFMVGICNLTTLHPISRICMLRYHSVQEAVGNIHDAIQDIIRDTHEICPGANAVFAPLTGIDLHRYNRGNNAEGDRMGQRQLNDMIQGSTEVIVQANQQQGLTPPWVNTVVHRKRDPHTPMRHRYDRLSDGCHLTMQTKIHWAHAIARCISFNLDIRGRTVLN